MGLVYDTEGSGWVEIENVVVYPDIVLGLGFRGGELPTATAVYFKPILEEFLDSISMWVLAIGHIWDEHHGFGQPVAAYIDLTLKP